jgi:hypothetical protein
MDIASKIEERMVKVKSITIRIIPKDRENLVKLLKSIPKKAKLDRLDEYMLNSLINALENPEVEVVKSKEEVLSELVEETKSSLGSNSSYIPPDKLDKVKIVNEIKGRVDVNGKEDITTWIKNSIKFGQDQFGIKTVPKAISAEAFYDWLLGEGIIFADGRPNPQAGKK